MMLKQLRYQDCSKYFNEQQIFDISKYEKHLRDHSNRAFVDISSGKQGWARHTHNVLTRRLMTNLKKKSKTIADICLHE